MRGDWALDDKGQRDNTTTNQTNKQTDERTNKAGATRGDDAARRGNGGGRFSAPKAPHSSTLKHRRCGWLLCCFFRRFVPSHGHTLPDDSHGNEMGQVDVKERLSDL
jgi:hypothetical protein